jgi:hypothetical protein
MLQRLFYVALGILIGCGLSYGVVSKARSQGVSFRLIGPNCAVVGDVAYYLETANPPMGWRQMPYAGEELPPVPVSSLISFGSGLAITESGEGWYRAGSTWTSIGTLSAVPVRQTSWGGLKSTYR